MTKTTTTEVPKDPRRTFRTQLDLETYPELSAPMGLAAFNKLIDETVHYEKYPSATDSDSTNTGV